MQTKQKEKEATPKKVMEMVIVTREGKIIIIIIMEVIEAMDTKTTTTMVTPTRMVEIKTNNAKENKSDTISLSIAGRVVLQTTQADSVDLKKKGTRTMQLSPIVLMVQRNTVKSPPELKERKVRN